MKRSILLIGATGFIGNALGRTLVDRGHRVSALTRRADQTKILHRMQIMPILWDGKHLTGWERELKGNDIIINLAGESIGSGRWNETKKKHILTSRVESSSVLVQALSGTVGGPELWVQASAVGYYGNRGDLLLQEQDGQGQGFLARVVGLWEEATHPIEPLGIRRVICRFGVVLGQNGGALARMASPFRFFLGGPLGSGKQWLSWIHLNDLVRALLFLIEQPDTSGIYNITSPHPVLQKELAQTIGLLLKRPAFWPMPAFLLKIILGEMAEELLLSSTRVLPGRLLNSGFSFTFPELEPALRDIWHKPLGH